MLAVLSQQQQYELWTFNDNKENKENENDNDARNAKQKKRNKFTAKQLSAKERTTLLQEHPDVSMDELWKAVRHQIHQWCIK